jgi:hypothetical protein
MAMTRLSSSSLREGERLSWTDTTAGVLSAATENTLLNRFDRPSPMAGEAEVKFLDGDFRIVRPGAFVRCAVTGVPIPLEELKYWSVEFQEPYASPEAVVQRLHPQRVK